MRSLQMPAAKSSTVESYLPPLSRQRENPSAAKPSHLLCKRGTPLLEQRGLMSVLNMDEFEVEKLVGEAVFYPWCFDIAHPKSRRSCPRFLPECVYAYRDTGSGELPNFSLQRMLPHDGAEFSSPELCKFLNCSQMHLRFNLLDTREMTFRVLPGWTREWRVIPARSVLEFLKRRIIT